MKCQSVEHTQKASSILVTWSIPKTERKLLGTIFIQGKGIIDIFADKKRNTSFEDLKNDSTISPTMFNVFWKVSDESSTY